MNRHSVCAWIERDGVVPVVRAPTAELAARAADALLEGGISVFEITLTVPDAVRVIASLSERYERRALIGAGTVLTAAQAHACMDAGARFIVSPGFDRETVDAARSRDVAVMPGALTPTEVIAASKAGADMVKIFPCSAMGGAKYLRALRAPLPDVLLLPTGGVTTATAHEYIAAGACALGVGAELVDVAAIQSGRPELVTERARALVEAVQTARASLAKGSR